MNAFKRYIRKKGIRLESDYETLPYDVQGTFGKPGHIFLDGVTVNSEKATITEYLNVMDVVYKVTRSGEIENVWED